MKGSPVQVRASALEIAAWHYPFPDGSFCRLHDRLETPDEEGWIVARVLEVPGALSQGRTREEARENVIDALRTVLTPDEQLAGQRTEADLEHLHFIAAA